MTTREPEWTELDRAELLALAEYRADLCPGGCGQSLAESTSHFEVGPEYDSRQTACRACAELSTARRVAADRNQGDGALFWITKTRR